MKLYLVMVAIRWEDAIDVAPAFPGFPAKVKFQGPPERIAPVYERREDAERDYPKAQIMEMETKPKPKADPSAGSSS